ncbi:MAG: DUF4330 family protein [Lachnospiraceae bacterium]|nr:DUF4330 family protein [Lachnospiraceae bacterium]
MSNEKKAAAYRFNVIDVILILLILAAGIWLWFILNPSGVPGSGTKTEKIELVFTQEALRSEFKGNVNIGDAFLLAGNGQKIGEVIGVSYGDSVYLGTDPESGEQVRSVLPGYIRMEVTVLADAEISGDGTRTVGTLPAAVGVTTDYRVPHLYGTATCTAVRSADEN